MTPELAARLYVIIALVMVGSFAALLVGIVAFPYFRARSGRATIDHGFEALQTVGKDEDTMVSVVRALLGLDKALGNRWQSALDSIRLVALSLSHTYYWVSIRETKREYVSNPQTRERLARAWKYFQETVELDSRRGESASAYLASAKLARVIYPVRPGLTNEEQREYGGQFLEVMLTCAEDLRNHQVLDAQAKARGWERNADMLPEKFLPAALFFYEEIIGMNRRSETLINRRLIIETRERLASRMEKVAASLRSGIEPIELEDLAA